MQIYFTIFFIHIIFMRNIVQSRTVYNSLHNNIRSNDAPLRKEQILHENEHKNYRNLRNLQPNSNAYVGNGASLSYDPNALSSDEVPNNEYYLPSNDLSKYDGFNGGYNLPNKGYEHPYMDDNTVGIVIDPRTRKAIGVLENTDLNQAYEGDSIVRNYSPSDELNSKLNAVYLPYERHRNPYNSLLKDTLPLQGEFINKQNRQNKLYARPMDTTKLNGFNRNIMENAQNVADDDLSKVNYQKINDQNNADLQKRNIDETLKMKDKQKFRQDNLVYSSRRDDVGDYENGNAIGSRLQKRYVLKSSKENNGEDMKKRESMNKEDSIKNEDNKSNNDNCKENTHEKGKHNDFESQKSKDSESELEENDLKFEKKKRNSLTEDAWTLNRNKRHDEESSQSKETDENKENDENTNFNSEGVETDSNNEFNNRVKKSDNSDQDSKSRNNDSSSKGERNSNRGKYDKTVESQIQAKLNTINEQVKREVDAQKADNLQADRKFERDKRLTLLEEENADINPDLATDDNLPTHFRRRRNYPSTFGRRKRSNAVLPYQQSAFLQYHGAEEEDNEGNEFDDDGFDDRTSGLVKKRDIPEQRAEEYDDPENYAYNQYANVRKRNVDRSPDYFSQVNDFDQQDQQANEPNSYSNQYEYEPEGYARRKRDDYRHANEEMLNNRDFRNMNHQSLSRSRDNNRFGRFSNLQNLNERNRNRDLSYLDNSRANGMFGTVPQTYREELTRLKRVKRNDNIG